MTIKIGTAPVAEGETGAEESTTPATEEETEMEEGMDFCKVEVVPVPVTPEEPV